MIAGNPTQAAISTHNINAKGVGQDNGDLTTDGQVIGGGLLQGTTEGSFVADDSDFPPIVHLAGTVVFTTALGTLTVSVTGDLDVSTGEFSASGPVTASTGKLAGATGFLTFDGVEDLTTGEFTQTIDGFINVDLQK